LIFIKNCFLKNAQNSVSELLYFKILWGGACPQTPLAARAFGTRAFLPRLGLKSGYGPVFMQIKLLSIPKVFNEYSFSNKGKRQIGNGLLKLLNREQTIHIPISLKLYLLGELLDEWDFQNVENYVHENALDYAPLSTDVQNLLVEIKAENTCE